LFHVLVGKFIHAIHTMNNKENSLAVFTYFFDPKSIFHWEPVTD